MTNYNYYQEVTNDIVTQLFEDYSNDELIEKLEFEDDFINELQDDLFTNDSVTGNASGSYTFNSFVAKDYVLENTDLLKESYEYFDEMETLGDDFINENWERMDVTIRCYILNECIPDAIEEVKENEDIQKLLKENELLENIYNFMDEYDFYNLQDQNFDQEEIKNTLENAPYEIISYLKEFENEESNAIINSINDYLLESRN